MKRDYLAEASFFAVIVGVSAWPIVSVMQAMAQSGEVNRSSRDERLEKRALHNVVRANYFAPCITHGCR